jgi:CubicO group peptidase (beta-lactamase class C family)
VKEQRARVRRREFLIAGSGSLMSLLAPRPAAGRNAGGSGRDIVASLSQGIPVWLKREGVPGAQVALLHGGRVVWSAAFGIQNRARGVPVTAETLFEAASLTKPLFAAVVMKLAARGALDIDQPLVDSMPQPFVSEHPFIMASGPPPDDPRFRLITPRLVLRHATGLPNWSRRKPLALRFPPGERWGYSGEGYVYLQRVVEHVTGQRLEALMMAEALAPLGMTKSTMLWEPRNAASLALGYDRKGEAVEWHQPTRALAAATLLTTADDYGRFLEAMLDPARAPRFGLGPRTREAMLVSATPIDGSLSWGLGWGLERTASRVCFWQSGDNDGFKNVAMGCPGEGTGLVLLTNGDNGMKVAAEAVPLAFPGKHPVLDFPMFRGE